MRAESADLVRAERAPETFSTSCGPRGRRARAKGHGCRLLPDALERQIEAAVGAALEAFLRERRGQHLRLFWTPEGTRGPLTSPADGLPKTMNGSSATGPCSQYEDPSLSTRSVARVPGASSARISHNAMPGVPTSASRVRLPVTVLRSQTVFSATGRDTRVPWVSTALDRSGSRAPSWAPCGSQGLCGPAALNSPCIRRAMRRGLLEHR